MAVPRDADDWASVETAADFSAYLRILSVDFDADVVESKARQEANGWVSPDDGRWAHWRTGDFLDAWGSWLSSMHDREVMELEPPSWRGFAFQLWAAMVYE